MLLPHYETVKFEHNERLQQAQAGQLVRAAEAKRRLAEPRPLFRSRSLRVALRRVFSPFTSA